MPVPVPGRDKPARLQVGADLLEHLPERAPLGVLLERELLRPLEAAAADLLDRVLLALAEDAAPGGGVGVVVGVHGGG